MWPTFEVVCSVQSKLMFEPSVQLHMDQCDGKTGLFVVNITSGGIRPTPTQKTLVGLPTERQDSKMLVLLWYLGSTMAQDMVDDSYETSQLRACESHTHQIWTGSLQSSEELGSFSRQNGLGIACTVDCSWISGRRQDIRW